MNGKLPKIIEGAKVFAKLEKFGKTSEKTRKFLEKKTLKCLKRKEILNKSKVPENELFQIEKKYLTRIFDFFLISLLFQNFNVFSRYFVEFRLFRVYFRTFHQFSKHFALPKNFRVQL